MASSVANVRTVDLGGGLSLITGNFTTTQGSAALSYAVVGMPIMWQVIPVSTVTSGTTAEPQDTLQETSIAGISVSSGIVTLTIYGNATITNGTFCLIVNKGG